MTWKTGLILGCIVVAGAMVAAVVAINVVMELAEGRDGRA